jgi:hypothetical protein
MSLQSESLEGIETKSKKGVYQPLVLISTLESHNQPFWIKTIITSLTIFLNKYAETLKSEDYTCKAESDTNCRKTRYSMGKPNKILSFS